MAKMTSIVATNHQPPLELMSKKVVGKPALKKILIPTTSGTGSEVSMFFVCSSGNDKYFMGSPYAYPEIAIIDPGPHRFHAAQGDGLHGDRRPLPRRRKRDEQIRQSLLRLHWRGRHRAHRQVSPPGHLQRPGPGGTILHVHGRHPGDDVHDRHRRPVRPFHLLCAGHVPADGPRHRLRGRPSLHHGVQCPGDRRKTGAGRPGHGGKDGFSFHPGRRRPKPPSWFTI